MDAATILLTKIVLLNLPAPILALAALALCWRGHKDWGWFLLSAVALGAAALAK